MGIKGVYWYGNLQYPHPVRVGVVGGVVVDARSEEESILDLGTGTGRRGRRGPHGDEECGGNEGRRRGGGGERPFAYSFNGLKRERDWRNEDRK